MPDKLLSEFPDVSYEAWRAQVDKDLKGADFQKKLVTRTLEGIEVQPLYVERGSAAESEDLAGLPPYRRGSSPIGLAGSRWDIRSAHEHPSIDTVKDELRADLMRGATSFALCFDASVRQGQAADALPTRALDGVLCSSVAELAALLSDVKLDSVRVALDAGGNAFGVAASVLALAKQRGVASDQLMLELGADPLGALARDGQLPHSLDVAAKLTAALAVYAARNAKGTRAITVSLSSYHDAGANSAQEIAYALATGVAYLRWLTDAGLEVSQAAAQIAFAVSIGSDLFMEIAKLRALRLCWAKVVAAAGGDAQAQNTRINAVTSRRTKTQRDPWVNMLRTTTESFAAMAGGADALTTRGFDEALGLADAFSRRVARNVQVVLNEEAHVTQVADPAGGSYYVEALTDSLARAAFEAFRGIEAQGGMASALSSGAIAQQISAVAEQRSAAIRKRAAPILGVSEYANLDEERVVPEKTDPATLRKRSAEQAAKAKGAVEDTAVATLAACTDLASLVLAALDAAAAGASIGTLSAAVSGKSEPARIAALPVRRNALPFETLRDRADAHQAKTGKTPTAFLCNLGAIPQHKARSTFSTGFLNAGGIAVLDNDGFATKEAVVAAFVASGTKVAVVCGSDEQYLEWVPALVPLLRDKGATEVVVAGRPGEHEAAFRQAGVTAFISMGIDVVATLSGLLDRMGVAS
jgi:methylmalonyl-CoA mutase